MRSDSDATQLVASRRQGPRPNGDPAAERPRCRRGGNVEVPPPRIWEANSSSKRGRGRAHEANRHQRLPTGGAPWADSAQMYAVPSGERLAGSEHYACRHPRDWSLRFDAERHPELRLCGHREKGNGHQNRRRSGEHRQPSTHHTNVRPDGCPGSTHEARTNAQSRSIIRHSARRNPCSSGTPGFAQTISCHAPSGSWNEKLQIDPMSVT
jgi:hypothetical protein